MQCLALQLWTSGTLSRDRCSDGVADRCYHENALDWGRGVLQLRTRLAETSAHLFGCGHLEGRIDYFCLDHAACWVVQLGEADFQLGSEFGKLDWHEGET